MRTFSLPNLLPPTSAFQTCPRKYKASYLSLGVWLLDRVHRKDLDRILNTPFICSLIHSFTHGGQALGRPAVGSLEGIPLSGGGQGLLSGLLPGTEPNTSAHRRVTELPRDVSAAALVHAAQVWTCKGEDALQQFRDVGFSFHPLTHFQLHASEMLKADSPLIVYK